MSTETGSEDTSMLSPDEAFALLGNEVRLEIMNTLGGANESLAYSALFDRIEYDDATNFNYHLGRLKGHFVRKNGDGYTLSRSGRRVIEAVLSGAVTEAPVLERTRIDWPCFRCGAPIEVNYHQEHVGMYCEECGGTRGNKSTTASEWTVQGEDILGFLNLPPAGVTERTPMELLQASSIWTTTNAMKMARGICPRCSAVLERSLAICEDPMPQPVDARHVINSSALQSTTAAGTVSSSWNPLM